MGLLVLTWAVAGCAGGGDSGADTVADPNDTGREHVGDDDDDDDETGEDETGDDETGDDQADELLYEALYDDEEIQRIDLALGEEALAALALDPRVYVSGSFEHDGTLVDNIGVRLKGTSVVTDAKPSFKLRFDEFDDLEYGPIERMTLNNMAQDTTQAREVIAWSVWRSAGMAAPRANYANVYLNGTLLGLYANVESIDGRYLRRHYEDADGALWQGNDSADFTEAGVDHFELVDGDGELASLDRARLAVWEEGDFYTNADAVIDMDQYLDYWSWAILVGSRDSYPYDLGDFYVYDHPTDHRFEFTPWGMDEAWDTDMQWDDAWAVLGYRCLYDEVCTTTLLQHASEALTVWDGLDVETLADGVYAISEQAMADDTSKPYTTSEVITARSSLSYQLSIWGTRVRTQMGITE